jgi:hypothetical protein
MQHAMLLARTQLERETGTKQIIMVTDGEPTAHIEAGEAVFQYPPSAVTVEETLRQVTERIETGRGRCLKKVASSVPRRCNDRILWHRLAAANTEQEQPLPVLRYSMMGRIQHMPRPDHVVPSAVALADEILEKCPLRSDRQTFDVLEHE